MFEMFSRWRFAILTGVVLLLVLPATGLAQRRRSTRKTPTAQPSSQPVQPTQGKPVTTEQPPEKTPAQKTPSQPVADTQSTKAKDSKGIFKLKVAKGAVRAINLKADKALVAEIAARLGKEFDVPVLLSPVMQKAKVTIDFVELPLETALRMIAPQPYVDYELSGDGSTLPKVVAIYLYAVNEPPPAESAVVRGDSEAILISGDTEEGTDAEKKDQEDKALSVKMERNQLTVHARKQPLTAVLSEIASKVDIPFEMKYDSNEVVNIDVSNATMEQVVRTLSPNIRLYQRTDLQTYETRPLRLVLTQPTSQTIKM